MEVPAGDASGEWAGWQPCEDPCAGLDLATCQATSGCQPVWGAEPCVCADGSMSCACTAVAKYMGCASATPPTSCTGDGECGAGSHCSTSDGDCMPLPGCNPDGACPAVCAGTCVPDGYPSDCFGIGDESACIGRADCEPVYAGSRCTCDAQGCGCLDYTFDSCRPRPTPPPTCLPPGAPADFVGTWKSIDGGIPRTYVLDAGGTFEVDDAVAPCPPDAACFWSGIVHNRGKWGPALLGTLGAYVQLEYEQPLKTWEGLRFPTLLTAKSCGPRQALVEADTGRAFARAPVLMP